MFCFNQTQETFIEGDFVGESFGTIEISIKYCNDDSNLKRAQKDKNYTPIKCKKDIMDISLDYVVLAVYFTDKIINPKNLKSPFQNVSKDAFWPISKLLSIYLK